MPAVSLHHAIVFVGVMPHAPILAPGVADTKHRLRVDGTIAAMKLLARRLLETRPDAVLVISPHAPRQPEAFGIWHTPLLRGSLEQFGAPETNVELPLDDEFSKRLALEARRLGLRTWRIDQAMLDHGATVPLSFVSAAGWTGPTAVAGLNELGNDTLEQFGHAIANASAALERRLAVIVSGDMSHHPAPSAATEHPTDSPFDQRCVELMRLGALGEFRAFDAALLRNAQEDIVAPLRVAGAATEFAAPEHEVLSYEAPFGVGYAVAILVDHPADKVELHATDASPVVLQHRGDLPAIARAAVLSRLEDGADAIPFQRAGELARPSGVFVTLRTSTGTLRGCWGNAEPSSRDLAEETWRCARLAAFRDPRFSRVTAKELPRLLFSVSVLSALEPAESLDQLDPARFGVVVRTHDGRNAVLLPHVKGVDTVEDQLKVARRKGTIELHEPVEISRFTAFTFSDPSRDEEDEEA